MFTNYEKLAKAVIKELNESPSSVSRALDLDLEEVVKEVQVLLVAECFKEVLKTEKVKLLEQIKEKDFVGEMRANVKASIEKEIKRSIDKVL